MRVSRSYISLGVLGIVFIASRIGYHLFTSFHFNTDALAYFIQYLDLYLLREDLLRSVWYLHFQPPAFNLFLGIVLKLFPDGYPAAFHVIYLLTGFAFSVMLLLLLKALGVNGKLALALVIVHMLLPTTVLYENLLFYSTPLALLLCASAYFLVRFLGSYQRRWAVLFFSTLTLISCIHAMFGIAWIFFVFLALLIMNKGRRAMIVRCAAVPLAIVIALSIKQYVLFGTFICGATYTPQNLAYRMTSQGDIPPEVRDQLLKSGDVPPYFFEYPWQSIRLFRNYMPRIKPTGVEALDQEVKSTYEPNSNNIGYLTVADGYMRGVRSLLRTHPEYYLNSFKETVHYFDPASDYDSFLTKKDNWLLRMESRLLCGRMREGGPGWVLVVSFPLLLAFGAVKLWKSYLMKDPRFLGLAFIVFNILYSSVLTVCLTYSEWNRYRFSIDPFYIVLLGLVLTGAGQWLGRAKGEKAEARGTTTSDLGRS